METRVKFNYRDLLAIVISGVIVTAVLIATIISFPQKDISQAFVEIYYRNKLVLPPLKLSEDREVILKKSDYQDFVGDEVVISIRDGGVEVEKEESPRKLCSKQGVVKTMYLPLICLPNSIQVIITDGSYPTYDGGLQ